MRDRARILDEDLVRYNPKRWRVNLPFRDYTIRYEDLIPAFSGAIGKIALVTAFVVGWTTAFGSYNPGMVAENVRLEIMVASIATLIFSAFLNTAAAPPGTLAPFIPLIPAMVLSGVHPLPLGLLIGFIGLILSLLKFIRRISDINGPGAQGGILLLFGVMGIQSSLQSLGSWVTLQQIPSIFIVLLLLGMGAYIVLNKYNLRSFIILACAALALIVSLLYGQYPTMTIGVGFPLINPRWWWTEGWGIGWGLNGLNFLNALPYALLAVVMWPTDGIAIKIIQESNYPKEANQAVFDMNSTFVICSIRNIIGVFLGGGQTVAVWRSFMIPLGMTKRPIAGSALFLSIFGILFSILGFPIDIAVFPPLLWLVLIFGVYIPLVEIGIHKITSMEKAKIATLTLLFGFAVNPIVGWIVSLGAENWGLIKDDRDPHIIANSEKLITAGIIAVTACILILTSVF